MRPGTQGLTCCSRDLQNKAFQKVYSTLNFELSALILVLPESDFSCNFKFYVSMQNLSISLFCEKLLKMKFSDCTRVFMSHVGMLFAEFYTACLIVPNPNPISVEIGAEQNETRMWKGARYHTRIPQCGAQFSLKLIISMIT
jgi:hypothetical protein